MKILSKIKKALWRIGIFFITLRTKVYALTPLYGIEQPEPMLYGIPEPKTADIITDLIRKIAIIFIPLILILGIIACIKKGEKRKLEKTIIILSVAVVIVLIILFIVGIISRI